MPVTNQPTPPATGAPPISVKPQVQAMTHGQLAAHARAAHGRASGTTPHGLRADHHAWVSGLLTTTRTTLTGIATAAGKGKAGAKKVAKTEEANRKAVAAADASVPHFTR